LRQIPQIPKLTQLCALALGWPATVVLGLATAVVAWLRPKRLTVVAWLSFVVAITLAAMSLSDPYLRRRMGSQDWVILAIFCGPVVLVGFVALAISWMH